MPRNRSLYRPNFQYPSASRRRFLQGSAAALAGMALSNCRQNLAQVSPDATASESGGTGGGPGGSGTLNIYTWAGYTDDALAAKFTEKTGIKAVIDVYDSNETMLAKLQASGGAGYSVIYPSDYMIAQMIEMEMLTPLDKARLQGTENMLDKWKNPVYDPNSAHSVAYSWGTTGLLYNRELVSGTPDDWGYLWDNQDALSRRITLLDDVRETLGAVLKSLGYSYNADDPKQLEQAYQRMLELKPHLAAFKSYGYEEQLLGGDLSMVMSYSVDAISITLEDDRMEFVIPASGSSVWTDAMVIPKTAPNVNGAYEWINFMMQPEVSKDTVERLSFATPNAVALDMVSDELRNNKDLFPPEALLTKCEGIAPLSDAMAEVYDRYWTEITSS